MTATIKEKPSKGTTLLSYGLLLCAGIFAWGVFTKDDDAAKKSAKVARVEPTPVTPAEPSPAPVVEPEKPKTRKGFKISAATLIAAYEANEVAADEKFKGKLIEVTGVIDSIAKDILGDPYVTLGSGKDFEIAHVQAMFPASAAKQLAGLRKGTNDHGSVRLRRQGDERARQGLRGQAGVIGRARAHAGRSSHPRKLRTQVVRTPRWAVPQCRGRSRRCRVGSRRRRRTRSPQDTHVARPHKGTPQADTRTQGAELTRGTSAHR